jgi:hypothetical protein
MQSASWYVRRLRGMSGDEILWRVKSSVRDLLDRGRFPLKLYPGPDVVPPSPHAPGFRVSDVGPAAWVNLPPGAPEAAWRDRLLRQAEAVLGHKLSFFNLEDQHLGDPIDWNRDHGNGRPAPLQFAPAIDYRDFRVTGDTKFVWEPSRHHQLVVLARAYRATGQTRFAAGVLEQIESWLVQCPFGVGMQWRSPLELAIRLINWVWALDLIHESGVLVGDLRRRVLHAVYLHLWETARKFSRGSSANNHLIGEAAGVFVGASYFPELPGSAVLREESREILAREIHAQTYADGCNREQALGYHLFVVQFFLVAGLAARRSGADFDSTYWARLQGMLEFVGRLGEGGPLSFFGDCDDGYVLDLGCRPADATGVLATGAVLFERADLKAWAGTFAEPAFWFLGSSARDRWDGLPDPAADSPLVSQAFADSGYYLLQHGQRGSADRVSVLFDCGELGYQSIAAHGHADALSFTLRAFGQDVFVDPGTYDYFTFREFRDYFRSTRAHNTVSVDDQDQSVMLGSFLWGARAESRCLGWEPGPHGGRVIGEHDGYARLPDPVVHRRSLTLDGTARTLTVVDEITARGAHDVALHFHLAAGCRLLAPEGPRQVIDVAGAGTVWMELDARLSLSTLRGSTHPIGGWVSPGYHRRTESTSLTARAGVSGEVSFTTRITLGAPRAGGPGLLE